MRDEVDLSRMAAAAFVAAACTAPEIAAVTGVAAAVTIAADSLVGAVVDADAEQEARRALLLARTWNRVAVVPIGPQLPELRMRRMARTEYAVSHDRNDDRRPHLRRGRFW